MSRSNGVRSLTLAIIASASVALSAHRLDEYLQAARIAVDPDRVQVELDLTPGIAMAAQVVSAIDRDRSGVISSGELDAYAASVRDAMTIEMDGRPLTLDVIDSQVASIESLAKGEGAIRLRLSAATAGLPSGRHRLLYRNAHRPDIGVYLANALVPASDRVEITGQRRDPEQRELTVEFVLREDSVRSDPRWLAANAGCLLLVGCALWWRRVTSEP